MKFIITFSAVVAVALAKPGFIAPIQHQYHAQDELGQYTYGYSGGPSAKVESRSADGVTRGAYSYIDSNGIVQNVNYQADPVNGFRVAATNLPVAPAVAPVAAVAAVAAPVPVVDTPEVAAAKAEHLAVKAQAEAAIVVAQPAPVVVAAPLPIVETPEVAEAKARHLATVAVAKATIVDDSAITDDGSYKLNPLEDDGEYRGEPANVVVSHSAVGPVAAVVTNDDSFLHDDGSYKINPLEDDGSYKGEVAVIGSKLIHSLAPARTLVAGNAILPTFNSYAAVRGYAAAAPIVHGYTAPIVHGYHAAAPLHVAPVVGTHSQYHAQDELGQYSYGYTGGLSTKHEAKSADGVTRGGYSYIDANGIVQSVNYISDPVNGFRVAATNLPLANH